MPSQNIVAENIAVIGLGYVGLPLADALSPHFFVTAFDVNVQRIKELKKGFDRTNELSDARLKAFKGTFTSDRRALAVCEFFIVTVPTPIDDCYVPDLSLIKKATLMIGPFLKKGSIVVFESTVYPGVTEDICGPLLEEASGLISGRDFFLGYSPERTNPGDKKHTLTKIVKVVSAQTPEALNRIASIYAAVISAGVYRAPSIKVAEAAKVIENTQRDVNIGLVNELSKVFSKMGLHTKDVLDTAKTKWNFLPFEPGLVGGHCIGVDPYYLTHKAQSLGVHPEMILAGRRINDGMGRYFAQEIIRFCHQHHIDLTLPVGVLGLTFKENCPDLRNSKVFDLVEELQFFGLKTHVYDPVCCVDEVQENARITLVNQMQLKKCSVIILAVAHHLFLTEGFFDWKALKVLADLKSCVDLKKLKKECLVWRP